MIKKLSHQVSAFAFIGSVGFVVDASILTYLSVSIGLNVYLSRFFSFALASFTTWLLNRKFTFKQTNATQNFSRGREYSRYLIIQIGGAFINLGIFMWLVTVYPALLAVPIIPLAVGSGIALFFNFIGARMWVFKK